MIEWKRLFQKGTSHPEKRFDKINPVIDLAKVISIDFFRHEDKFGIHFIFDNQGQTWWYDSPLEGEAEYTVLISHWEACQDDVNIVAKLQSEYYDEISKSLDLARHIVIEQVEKLSNNKGGEEE